ncbi:hypothetical protein ACTGYR_11470, partial [Streptococcus suis]
AGTVLILGSSEQSRWARWITGSSHVGPAGFTILRPLLVEVTRSRLRHDQPRTPAAVAAVAALVLGAVLAVRHRRRG